MDISREEVLHIARLARINLSEAEIEGYQKDLNSILQYVAKLEQLDTTQVEPTTHAVPLELTLREDEVIQRLTPEEILSNAPAVEDGHFRVPRVVED